MELVDQSFARLNISSKNTGLFCKKVGLDTENPEFIQK